MRRRRHLLLLFVGFVCCAVSLAYAAEVELVRVWPGWRDAEYFERIGDYFGRSENPGGQILLRTQADVRAGYYFLVRVKAAAAVAGARFELSVIRPDAPEPKTFTFSAALPARQSVFQLGLTGDAWPGGKKDNPAAWKLTLVDAGGRLLAEQKSFLWERPAK
ncbi:MAG: hypothetical protein HY736_25735 [Verrucomicrobia bacterium]|nr:hypothetical protein [Verrucomicrobiota bacterium]